MALKRRTKVNEAFSMASMTDVIFLLLIFFMVTSTVVIPNAIKVTLPQAQSNSGETSSGNKARLDYCASQAKVVSLVVANTMQDNSRRPEDVRRLICRRDRALQRDCKMLNTMNEMRQVVCRAK